MKRWFLGAALCLALSAWATSAAAQEDPYRTLLSEVLDKSGTLTVSDTMMEQIIPMFRKIAPDVPEAYWEALRRKWAVRSKEQLTDLYLPIYRRYLSLEELQQIAAFYDSPAGRKLAAARPAMTQESLQAGQQLGLRIAGEIREELKAQGYVR